MSASTGHIELDRTVESIQVGQRHRRDMGDLDALVASIARDGLLQPITITPDGVLVCGSRRLAAVKKLGWRTVNVWVRSAISDRLAHLLAEQDDNQLHKSLSPLEAEGLYREIKQLLAEDASRRQVASRFSGEHQPGADGGANFAPPSPVSGKSRAQAAAMIPGGPSHTTLDKISYLRDVADDTTLPDDVRERARDGLVQIDAGAPVHPIFQSLHDARLASENERDERLHELAEQALARVRENPKKRPTTPRPAPATREDGLVRYPVRAFALTWAELHPWWMHSDLDELAETLSDEQADAFYATAEGTHGFAVHLREAREGSVGGRHLRAL